MRRIKLVDVSFSQHDNFNSVEDVLYRHQHGLGHIDILKEKIEITLIRHIRRPLKEKKNGIQFSFFRGYEKYWYIPLKTLLYIRKLQPDVVLVHGLVFPLQVIFLKMFLRENSVIIIQHHAEKPGDGIRKRLQKLADKFVDAYLFTALQDANMWVVSGIIKGIDKCHEIQEVSTLVSGRPRQQCRDKLGIGNGNMFLWVGRLEKNKDPLTVIEGFSRYLDIDPSAKLYMLYQAAALLPEVENFIHQNPLLQHAVVLVGERAHEEISYWFSAADFYISGSHQESSGSSLLECMACGCVPIVTNIPSFRKITLDSKYGVLYEAGNAGSLFFALEHLKSIKRESMVPQILNHFQEKLSFKAIANDLYALCIKLCSK